MADNYLKITPKLSALSDDLTRRIWVSDFTPFEDTNVDAIAFDEDLTVDTTGVTPSIAVFTGGVGGAYFKNLSEDTNITVTWTDNSDNDCEKNLNPGGILFIQNIKTSTAPTLSTSSGTAKMSMMLWGAQT